MPVLALYEFNDTDTTVRDSALGNGAQDGLYWQGASASGGRLQLDGVNDVAKIYNDPAFQMDRGTLEIQFSQTEHVGNGPNTVLSRDSVNLAEGGGYRIEVYPDGSVMVSHETASETVTYSTGPGFLSAGDEINLTYSWNLGGTGGSLIIQNQTQGTSFSDEVPNTVTMDMGSLNQNWIIGAAQDRSDPNTLNNIDKHFDGQVEMFSLSDTVDNCGNANPVANPDVATTDEDTAVVIDVLANDTDGNFDPLTVTTATATNGTVTINGDGTLTYTPNANYNGPDQILYSIEDGNGGTATSTVAVTVNPVNDAPVANDDIATTALNTPVVIDVLGNDTDVDGDTLAVLGTPVSADGTVTVNGDGTLTFTPTTGFVGEATISYDVTDGNGGTDTAVVIVTVGQGTRDGYVDGAVGADLIDLGYAGDPDGDFIDNSDALLSGDAPNDDRVRAGAGNDTVFAGLGDDSVLAGLGDDEVYGEEGDDTLVGGAGADTLNGGDGSDSVTGGDGDDFIDTRGGGAGPLPDRDYPGLFPADLDPANDLDTVFGNLGNDTILTGDDADLVYGGQGADRIDGGFDDDTLYGGADSDTIIGGEGSDSIHGGGGGDLIYGGLGPSFPDELNIRDDDPATPDLRPDNGRDTITGAGGDDTIFGLDDNDLITGDLGNDLIDGGVDNDTIYGGLGNDTIIGGHGADLLVGGADQDVFLGSTAGDVIDGMETGVDFDTLDLRGSGPVRVVYDADNAENGVVSFLDADRNVIGTTRFTNIENVIPCFTPGTLIATPRGERPVEDLRIGDKVITRDNGIQEIRWVGRKDLDHAAFASNPHLRPVLIRQGSLGNGLPERDMLVSPNHRVLVANDRTALYFDEHEVLVSAKHLVGTQGIAPIHSAGTAYIHFMCDRHEVVLSNGAWTESFQPGDYTLQGMGNAQRTEIYELFPELKTPAGMKDYTAARKTLKRHEAVLLTR